MRRGHSLVAIFHHASWLLQKDNVPIGGSTTETVHPAQPPISGCCHLGQPQVWVQDVFDHSESRLLLVTLEGSGNWHSVQCRLDRSRFRGVRVPPAPSRPSGSPAPVSRPPGFGLTVEIAVPDLPSRCLRWTDILGRLPY